MFRTAGFIKSEIADEQQTHRFVGFRSFIRNDAAAIRNKQKGDNHSIIIIAKQRGIVHTF